ncbi:MAG: lysylphosphatidylglycerol synthase domain-containing protein [Polaromonas sp.]|nr:lysylphosphatidylglycerol synthase domain-containing protein [Polaromonas sp.]
MAAPSHTLPVEAPAASRQVLQATAATRQAEAVEQPSGFTSRRWWPWLRRILTLVFFGLVAWLLVSQARAIEWHEVFTALKAYPATALFGAVGLAAASYLLYSCFDLLGRHYTGHTLPRRTVMLVTAISYAFNLNLGSWVGGVAFRYRLYSQLGLAIGTITRVMSLSMLANWMGYVLLAGATFTFAPPTLPDNWDISASGLRWIGLVLLVVALAYLGLCAFSRRRIFMVRGHELELPSISLALIQLGMGAANWLLMSGIIFVLLRHQVEFAAVVSVLLLAAIAGVITHIPGNIGVLEAVFVALLGHLLPPTELLAALVAYRCLYYILPLVLGGLAYLAFEIRMKRQTRLVTRRAPS